VQPAFAEVELPDEPPDCSRRRAIFLAHVRDGRSDRHLAVEFDLVMTSIRRIATEFWQAVLKPRIHLLVRRFGSLPLVERPMVRSERG
jgi:hypothetical protein